ncbi:DUF421 domain-containing protein [Brevibacterium salitolerans]|uniref:DUF421 domain-containing protein n=1 Tax=Brevibacterium salitolerans TaxID=1403566 RepID=A0ABP5I329_9MICO
MQPEEGWGAYLLEHVGMEPYRVPVVVLSAVVIYLVFLLLVRLFGPRVLTVTSGFDAVVFVMFGAVAGRVVLGHPPTVAAGVVGLCTLMLMEAVFGAVERTWQAKRLISAGPIAVFAHGAPLEEACRRTHTSPADLHSAMRRAGIAHPAEVRGIIMESNGSYSVIRVGARVSLEVLAHVEGAARILAEPEPDADSNADPDPDAEERRD